MSNTSRHVLRLFVCALVGAQGCGLTVEEGALFVGRATSSAPTAFTPCSNAEAPGANLGLEIDTAVDCGFVAGRDRIDILVDYGPLSLEPGESAFEAPKITLTRSEGGTTTEDGVAPMRMESESGGEPRWVSRTTVRLAPSSVAQRLRVSATVDDQYVLQEPDEFTVAPATLLVGLTCVVDEGAPCVAGASRLALSVDAPRDAAGATVDFEVYVDDQRRGDVERLDMVIEGDRAVGRRTLESPADARRIRVFVGYAGIRMSSDVVELQSPTADFGLVGCASDPCSYLRGVGVVRAALETELGLAIDKARVELLVDGFVADSTEADLVSVDGRRRGSVSFRVPGAGGTLQVRTRIADRTYSSSSAPLVDWPLELAIDGCTDADCAKAADVGLIRGRVRAPEGTTQNAVTLNVSVDDVPYTTLTPTLTPGVEVNEATFEFAAPPFGQRVSLRAVLAQVAAGTLAFDLVPPALTLEVLECAITPCRLPTDTEVTIEVSAPADIRSREALVQLIGDGRPGAFRALALTRVQGARIYGTLSVLTPTVETAEWELRGQLGRQTLPGVVARVEAP